MNKKKRINITSGESFNEYIKTKINGIFVPFNEALMEGKPLFPLFDENFINERVMTHYNDLSKKDEYIKKMEIFIKNKELILNSEELILWFGEDTFCLINLLGLLTFLENNSYHGKLLYNIVDEEKFVVKKEGISIELGNFTNSYVSLFNENVFVSTKNQLIDKGIKTYLELQDENHFLVQYIKDNIDKMEEYQLLINLLNMTLEYGLSDVQLMKMINKYR